MIVNFFDDENYFIHGLNPKLPEQCILQAKGEILMEETNYRVGGVNSPIEVGPITQANFRDENPDQKYYICSWILRSEAIVVDHFDFL